MRNSSPKYQLIAEELRGKILRGELPAGKRLPGQFELAAQYDVSSITANRALNELRAYGLIERRERSGSYVAESPRPLSDLLMVMSGEYDNQAQWLSPYWQTISALAAQDGISARLISRKDPGFDSLVFGGAKGRTGLILLAFEDTNLLEKIERDGVPHVVVGIEARHARYCSHENRRNAAMALTQRLIDNGCRRLAFIGNLEFPNHRSARDGYLDAVANSTVTVKSQILPADEDSAVRTVERLLSRKNPPDGMVIAGSLMPFLTMPSIRNSSRRPALGVMTDNQDILKLKGAATIASYSQKRTAELAYRLLLDAASGRVSSPTAKLAEFEIIPVR